MFIRTYLRAPNDYQNTEMAKEPLNRFATDYNQRIVSYYIENVNVDQLDRPELHDY